MIDLDKDGVLSDAELNAFQTTVFRQPLSPEELDGIKACLAETASSPKGALAAIDVDAFLFLNKLFIQRGRLETTWAVLRHYGFRDDLSLAIPELPKGEWLEWSDEAEAALLSAFVQYDRDQDGKLANDEFVAFLKDLPNADFHVSIERNGGVSLEGFLSYWHAFLFLRPQQAVYAAYWLGADVRKRLITLRKKRRDRTVFRVSLIGARGVGKTTLLRDLIRHGEVAKMAVNKVSGRYLIVALFH